MAHYVVLLSGLEGSERWATGLAYTAVPAGNNSAGVPWVDVVRGYRRYRNRRFGTTLQAAIPVDATTQAGLDAGTLFEWNWSARFPSGANNAQAVAAISAAVNAQESAMITFMGDELRYWGFEGDS